MESITKSQCTMESIKEKEIFLSDLNYEKAKETHLSAEKSKRSKLCRAFVNIKMFTIIAASSLIPLFPCMNINASNHANSTCTTEKEDTHSATTAAYALIFIGMILGGICKAVRTPLVTCYIDDNIDKVYIGGYVNVNLTPMDSKWIGAWWLGFATFAGFSLLVALPLFAFPRSFNNLKDEEEKEDEKPKLSLKGKYR
ncbi:solute carrier organic anion transporter family, member 3A [Octopus vulgaris]|uniref:Solute carrier organic anion transporter family, member 3A n=1 Tax=Octopus vulgaris TaxID=6645 RepID=A0AA36ATV0_OCTVU|nr:solute carrier organic anion transporter family, member 3A [Octopus vulgaris]